jgi:hypothetical protein
MTVRDVRLVQGVICRTYFTQFAALKELQRKVHYILYHFKGFNYYILYVLETNERAYQTTKVDIYSCLLLIINNLLYMVISTSSMIVGHYYWFVR